MEIIFSDQKLKTLAEDFRKCQKEMGERRAKLFNTRLNALYLAESLEATRNLPGHFHALKENRSGQWACDLDQPYRLIFEPREAPSKDGPQRWVEVKAVIINEITNYHGK